MTVKNKKKLDAKKQRNFWGMNPKTRVQPNGKAYNRQSFKKANSQHY